MKYIKKYEGVGEKFLKRKFGIPDEDDDFEVNFQRQNIESDTDPVAYVEYEDPIIFHKYHRCPIYKNPKSLEGFDFFVRAIGDEKGNIYVAQYDGDFVHGDMGDALGFSTSKDEIYNKMNKYSLLNRVKKENAFGLSDSSYEELYEPDNKISELLNSLSKKNSQFKYYSMFYHEVKKDSVAVNESKFEDDEFETDYQRHINKVEPVAYIKAKSKNTRQEVYSPIVKNPDSLANFDSNVKAIGTSDGDLFVVQQDLLFIHSTMGEVLGFVEHGSKIYKLNDRFVFLTRLDKKNTFCVCESTEIFNRLNSENLKVSENILREIKKKNLSFDFYNINRYDLDEDTKPVNMVESKIQKKGFIDRFKNMFEFDRQKYAKRNNL